MSQLILIRHGQASFGQENYDLLSDLGKQQCAILGRSHQGQLTPHRLVSGTLVRQQQSLNCWLDGYKEGRKNEMNLPFQQMAEFNEFDTEDVMAVAFPEFESRENMIRHLTESDNPKKAFHKLYQQAVHLWMKAESDKYQESFIEFNQRVNSGLNSLINSSEPSSTTVLFSSGGPIAMCLQSALGLSAEKAFDLNEAMANSSVSRLVFNQAGKINVSYFNCFSHLKLAENQVTYR